MKHFALWLLEFSVMSINSPARAQSVKIDFLSNSEPAGKIFAKCTVMPHGEAIDAIYLLGVPGGGGKRAVAKKDIDTPVNRPLTVELTTNTVGGQIAYECFALIKFKKKVSLVYFASKKDLIMVRSPKDATDYGKAELPVLDRLGAGRDLAKIGYKNGGDWRAKYKSAVLYLLPKEGWPAEVVAVPKTAGKDEWESKNGTFPRSAHVAFAAIEIYDIKDPLAKLETRLATKLKKMEE